MQILELPSGDVSLEFKPREATRLLRRLEEFGAVQRTLHSLYEVVRVGTVSFVHYNEWDEPCLISTSAEGSALLRKLAAKGERSEAA